ncbi:MAG TPA: nitronate monooxygenase [Solirubrobacteraceae bacterium]|nr:nitronate monooxygenase [Solirubrobacteraceae bacterium]
MVFDLRSLKLPIVQAPMAGGPSTPALAAAVGEAGGLGFLAAGYKTPDAVAEDIAALRAASDAPFGVNLFAPSSEAEAHADVVAAYARTLAADADRHGVSLGGSRFDDDGYAAKVELMTRQRVPVVSFTFGCPAPETVAALHSHDIAVWVTVTNPAETALAQDAGADALVAQGTEAGGHRAYFSDAGEHEEYGLLVLLHLLRTQSALPLIATGGLMDGPGIAAALVAGASAVQLGSALMLTPEAGTSEPHRARLAVAGPTRLTRAFSGRTARGIVSRFMDEHDADAPSAYPQVHHLTSPLRAAARAAGDADAINLWAGQGHASAQARPAGELVRALGAEAEAAARGA